MSLTPSSPIRPVEGVGEGDQQRIYDFLQGAAYCWCKNRKDEWFGLRDLMGGDNFEWEGTPLFVLYSRHCDAGLTNDDAIKQAGIDGGWLLKAVLSEDRREFETERDDLSRRYRWINN